MPHSTTVLGISPLHRPGLGVVPRLGARQGPGPPVAPLPPRPRPPRLPAFPRPRRRHHPSEIETRTGWPRPDAESPGCSRRDNRIGGMGSPGPVQARRYPVHPVILSDISPSRRLHLRSGRRRPPDLPPHSGTLHRRGTPERAPRPNFVTTGSSEGRRLGWGTGGGTGGRQSVDAPPRSC